MHGGSFHFQEVKLLTGLCRAEVETFRCWAQLASEEAFHSPQSCRMRQKYLTEDDRESMLGQ